jgi:hypothetical protein
VASLTADLCDFLAGLALFLPLSFGNSPAFLSFCEYICLCVRCV